MRALPKEHTIDLQQQTLQLFFVRGAQHQHTATLTGWKPRVIEIVAIQRQQCAAQLQRQVEVRQVGRAPEFFFFHHEEQFERILLQIDRVLFQNGPQMPLVGRKLHVHTDWSGELGPHARQRRVRP